MMGRDSFLAEMRMDFALRLDYDEVPLHSWEQDMADLERRLIWACARRPCRSWAQERRRWRDQWHHMRRMLRFSFLAGFHEAVAPDRVKLVLNERGRRRYRPVLVGLTS